MRRNDDVLNRLRAYLLSTRNADGGWPYYAGRGSRLEPTAWALLALSDPRAAGLIELWRTSSGLLVEPAVGSVNYAFNAIAALTLAGSNTGSRFIATSSAVAKALLAHHGEKVPRHPAVRQDPTLVGWSWTDGTFSWVEPTGWCLLAIKKLVPEEPTAKPRLDEAEKVLMDRACAGGGWNYGNAEVYGKNLPAHVPPTAIGVLALQNRAADRTVQQAIAFLETESIREGSTTALAFAWLALAALNRSNEALVARLSERLAMTESIGNLASAAVMLYVLSRQSEREAPVAFML